MAEHFLKYVITSNKTRKTIFDFCFNYCAGESHSRRGM